MGKDTRGREALVRLIINQRTRRERQWRIGAVDVSLCENKNGAFKFLIQFGEKKSHCIFSSLENLTASFSCWSKRMEGEKKDRIQEKE